MADELPTAKLRFGTTSGVLIGAVDENGFIDGNLDPTRLGTADTIGGTNLVIVGVGSLMKAITLTNLVTVLKAAGIAATTHTHAGAYEPVITAGTAAQYLNGSKEWKALNQAAVAGLTITDNPSFASLSTGGTQRIDGSGNATLLSALINCPAWTNGIKALDSGGTGNYTGISPAYGLLLYRDDAYIGNAKPGGYVNIMVTTSTIEDVTAQRIGPTGIVRFPVKVQIGGAYTTGKLHIYAPSDTIPSIMLGSDTYGWGFFEKNTDGNFALKRLSGMFVDVLTISRSTGYATFAAGVEAASYTISGNTFMDSGRALTAVTATIGAAKQWGKQATAPTCAEGSTYYNTTDHVAYCYNGSEWKALY